MTRILPLLFLTVLASTTRAADLPAESPIEPIKAPFEMSQLQRPVFPANAVSITDFGAVEGGSVKNTAAFAKAIETCSDKGGGTVIVPAGKWLTGPIRLKSRINLRLEKDARIVFSDAFEDYLPPVFVRAGGIEIYNYSPLIYARDCEDIAITGPGYLDGNAAKWWELARKEPKTPFEMGAKGVPVEKRVFGTPEAMIRPSFVQFVNCRNILLEDFTIGSGPNWTIHPVYCENLIARRLTIDTHGPNNDGLDPDSCRNVLMEYCLFRTGDDCMAIKSGYNEDGWRVGRPTENVVMRYCSGKEGHGALVIGSEMSGSVRNVYMHDCEFEGTDRALRIKSRADRGGVVENVWVENVKARDMKREAVLLNMKYGSDRQGILGNKPPRFRNIHVKNLRVDGAKTAVDIEGIDPGSISGVTLEDMAITCSQGVVIKDACDITLSGALLTPTESPVIDIENSKGIRIRNTPVPSGVPVFLKVSGSGSEGIEVQGNGLKADGPALEFSSGAARQAVSIKP
jgi:polygalacturonase